MDGWVDEWMIARTRKRNEQVSDRWLAFHSTKSTQAKTLILNTNESWSQCRVLTSNVAPVDEAISNDARLWKRDAKPVMVHSRIEPCGRDNRNGGVDTHLAVCPNSMLGVRCDT